MPSNFRRFAPIFILLMIIWSFMVNFTFGLLALSSVCILGACIYQMSVKKWQDIFEDDLANFDFGNFEDELGPNLPKFSND